MPGQIADEIRQFLVDEVLEGPEFADFPVDAPLLSGVIDSFGLVTLIDFLEDRFGVTIGNEEMVKDNFRSVEALAAFIESKRRAGSSGDGPLPPPEG
jgi:acyl carrier protein